ncbi:hypothetical protein F7725_012023 [Dissostichus mawsoni]|uniref:Uncharacterized protein n=1 Tax=Dissostichus mawsoni TaxID=36200 RepID=A0A7J5ZAH1_DISMA|nr:hypothetical protein F7725_012023 [Dissostichus mawsoni]
MAKYGGARYDTNMITYTGKVNADAFQISFLQYVYCKFEENKLLGSPEMVAVSVDGNRKLYRFQKINQKSNVWGISLDSSKETSNLNMYRREIFAYPMFLQKEFHSASFLAMDVTCRYAPYLDKVSEALPHLQPLNKGNETLLVCDACPSLQYQMRGTRRVPAPLLVKKWNKLTASYPDVP